MRATQDQLSERAKVGFGLGVFAFFTALVPYAFGRWLSPTAGPSAIGILLALGGLAFSVSTLKTTRAAGLPAPSYLLFAIVVNVAAIALGALGVASASDIYKPSCEGSPALSTLATRSPSLAI